jgi:ribosome-binding protein aMBF1 (putative translation factor)
MAICELCGREVQPIDKIVRGAMHEPHYFCSADHGDQWVRAQKAPKKAPEAAPAPAEETISADSPLAEREVAPRRRPGRPKGSKNRT